MWKDTVATIKNELTDFVKVKGGEVSDLPLSLINRARKRLCMSRPWEHLCKLYQLDPNSSNVATLPSDFGRILSCFHDSDADGRPDWFYYLNDPHIDHRYEMRNTFTNAAGITWTIKFPEAPDYDPYIYYQIGLDACTTNTDYLGFPGELVLRAAQVIHITEKNLRGSDVQAIKTDWMEQLRDFEAYAIGNNHAMDMYLKDSTGEMIATEAYTLDGSISRFVSARNNSYDYGG